MPYNEGANRDLTIYIRKIEIIETLYPPAFSLQSSISSLTCGTTPSVTFTVNNLTYTPGVTSYVWNLGATANGWRYGGSAAPATITTSTNTLTLGTTCGVKPKPVSVSVTAMGSSYATNAVTLSITQPNYTISGNATLCTTTGTYQVNGLPCGATVSWTSSPSGVITHPSSGNPITVTKTGNGQVLLTANITACGITTAKNYSIHAGLPQPATNVDIYGSGYDGEGCSETSALRAEAVVSLSNDGNEWFLGTGITSSASGGSNPFTLGSGGLDIPINVTTTTPSFVRVRTINACGMSAATFGFISRCSHFAKGEESEFSVSPNPTNGIITVETKESKIVELQVIDKTGNIKFTRKYIQGQNSATIDISSLSTDTYYLNIYDGMKWETKQVIKSP